VSDDNLSRTDEYYLRRAERYGTSGDGPLTPAQRSARYRDRQAGRPGVPNGKPGRRGWFAYAKAAEGAGAELAEIIKRSQPMSWAEALRVLGLGPDADPQRVRDHAAAAAAKAKRERNETRARVESLALGLKRARRRADLLHADWRAGTATLAEVDEANKTRDELAANLREVCLNDISLIADIMGWADGR
jgi:hypothetical protein